MWPFRKATPNTDETLGALYRELRARVTALEEDLEKLTDAHVRLRGKIYAHKLHKPETDEREPNGQRLLTRADKDAFLRKAGVRPGQPFHHSE